MTRAVVIGIFDYQDDAIPDLRFADKDAEAFANFLRSPADGSLDNDHLRVLTNDQFISTLSTQNLEKVTVITDACHAVFTHYGG